MSTIREEKFEAFVEWADSHDNVDWELTHEAEDDTDRIGLHVSNENAELGISITDSGDIELTYDEEEDLTDEEFALYDQIQDV